MCLCHFFLFADYDDGSSIKSKDSLFSLFIRCLLRMLTLVAANLIFICFNNKTLVIKTNYAIILKDSILFIINISLCRNMVI